jgi:hypothetical protein
VATAKMRSKQKTEVANCTLFRKFICNHTYTRAGKLARENPYRADIK